jgi:hypothetical protein
LAMDKLLVLWRWQRNICVANGPTLGVSNARLKCSWRYLRNAAKARAKGACKFRTRPLIRDCLGNVGFRWLSRRSSEVDGGSFRASPRKDRMTGLGLGCVETLGGSLVRSGLAQLRRHLRLWTRFFRFPADRRLWWHPVPRKGAMNRRWGCFGLNRRRSTP